MNPCIFLTQYITVLYINNSLFFPLKDAISHFSLLDVTLFLFDHLFSVYVDDVDSQCQMLQNYYWPAELYPADFRQKPGTADTKDRGFSVQFWSSS